MIWVSWWATRWNGHRKSLKLPDLTPLLLLSSVGLTKEQGFSNIIKSLEELEEYVRKNDIRSTSLDKMERRAVFNSRGI